MRGLGALLRERGEFKAAVEKLSESLKIDPENTFALSNRAYSYSMLDDLRAAVADAAAVTKLDPRIVDSFDLQIWLLTSLDEKTEALRVIDAMLAANPDNDQAQLVAARNYSRLGKSDEAVKMMNLVIAKSPTAENYLQRAHVRDAGDVPGKLADTNAALTQRPDMDTAQMLRAQLESERGDHAAAIALYSEKLKSEKSARLKRNLHTLRGIELIKTGARAGALRDFTAALADSPDGDSYNNHCWSLSAARVELDAALAACDKALAVAPKDAAYLDSRGFVLLQLGRYDEAIAAYDGALTGRPKQSSSLYGRGIGKNRRCKCAEGDADLKAAAQNDPSVVQFFRKVGLAP
jgi:tetratricopeptide (TPR) repeat protein